MALLLFALVAAMNGLDQWLVDTVFRWEGMQWALCDRASSSGMHPPSAAT